MTDAQPRGWYHGWTIVGALVLSQVAANSLTYYCFPQFVPLWAAELHVRASDLQLAIFAMLLGAAPASVVVGLWADRYPARRLFGAGLAGMALFYLAISYVTQLWQVIALYFALAAPALTLCTSVAANPLVTRWFVRRLGLALGITTCGVGLAAAILPKIVAHFLPESGWRTIWRVGALIVAVAVLPVLLAVLRDRPQPRDGYHYLDAQPPFAGHGDGPAGGGIGWRQVMARPNFWVLVAVYLVMIGGGTAFVQNMGSFGRSRGLGLQDTATLIAAVGIAHVCAAIVMGALSDRFGNRLPLAGMALAVAAGIGLLAVGGNSLPLLVLGAGLIGLNAAVFTPLSAAIATEFGAAAFGRAFGLAMLFLPLSQLLPFAVQRSAEATGSYLPGMAGCAALLVIVAGLSLLLRERAPAIVPAGEPLVAAGPLPPA